MLRRCFIYRCIALFQISLTNFLFIHSLNDHILLNRYNDIATVYKFSITYICDYLNVLKQIGQAHILIYASK